MRPFISVNLLLVTLASTGAGAAVFYKLTDPRGAVTYADSVPRGFEGTVKRLDVDSGANVIAPARIPEVLAQPPAESLLALRRNAWDDRDQRLRAAEARLDAARAALADAQNNSTAEDWQYLIRPHPNTGARRTPRPEYLARLEKLEQDVAAAQESLDAVRRETR